MMVKISIKAYRMIVKTTQVVTHARSFEKLTSKKKPIPKSTFV